MIGNMGCGIFAMSAVSSREPDITTNQRGNDMLNESENTKPAPEYIALQLILEMIKTGQVPPSDAAIYYKRYVESLKQD